MLAQVESLGARVLAAGRATHVEGPAMPNHNVIIEFPDEQTALAWYHSDEYGTIRPIRLAASSSTQVALVNSWRA
jgi:uncharacterized protein (DUF1330 family)